MRILRVGDPHVRVSNLEESEALMHFVLDEALSHKVDRIELLGDLMHTHAVIRLEVLDFWKEWLGILSEGFEVVVLVGNHDQSGDHNNSLNSLSVFTSKTNKNLHIVQQAKQLGVYGYVPYIHSEQRFLEAANALALQGAKTIVCHQTFNGARYEGGMYAPDGFDQSKLEFGTVISGHIHATQKFGKVTYPGTPRWDSIADANENKGIWLYEHGPNGEVLSETLISTAKVCTPIVSLKWVEGTESPVIPEGAKVVLELEGSSAWVQKSKEALRGSVSLKTKITDSSRAKTRQAGNSFEHFLTSIYKTDLNKEELVRTAKELGLV